MADPATLWTFVAIVPEGRPVTIGGVNVWDQRWQRVTADPITVSHPNYPDQRHKMWPYRIRVGDADVIFAAGVVRSRLSGHDNEPAR